MAKLTVIGIGYKSLDGRSRRALSASEFVLGSRRLIEVFEGYPEYGASREKIKRIDSVSETMAFIHESFNRGVKEIVLLGSGDPLFFGIGALAVRELGPDMVEIIPDLTSLQTAFSAIKESWDDALFISFHGGPDLTKRRRLKYGMEDLPALLEDYDTIGILTDRENDPTAIARFLVSSVPYHPSLQLFVGERMGYEDGRITQGTPEKIAGLSFVHPNVVIIKRKGRGDAPSMSQSVNHQSSIINPVPSLPRFGLKEGEISHSRGLITKDEVRAVSIHALRLPKNGVFWDIGAGSGAVSLEVARLSPWLDVFAIEKDAVQVGQIERNKAAFAALNITITHGEAPAALSLLPAPDRVFVGGSSGKLKEIMEVLGTLMRQGIVVVNAATLETLNEALEGLEKAGFSVRVSQVSIARSRPIGNKRYLAALNPVFVVVGERSKNGTDGMREDRGPGIPSGAQA